MTTSYPPRGLSLAVLLAGAAAHANASQPPGTYGAGASPFGLIAGYGFDDGGEETKGSGIDGTLVGDASLASDPERGEVLQLGGYGYIEVSPHETLDIEGVQFSMTAWVRPEAPWVSQVVASREGYYEVIVNQGAVGHANSVLWSAPEFGVHGTLPLEEWSHIAVTYDGTVTRFYVDGQQAGTSDAAFGPLEKTMLTNGQSNTDSPFLIGSRTSPDGEGFVGLLDDVGVFGKTLTASEVRDVKNYGLSGAHTAAESPLRDIRTFAASHAGPPDAIAWSGYHDLYFAVLDANQTPLRPAARVLTVPDRITGVTQPARLGGGWIVAVRTTNPDHDDALDLITIDADGGASRVAWIQGSGRVSLPVFFSRDEELQAFYFATGHAGPGVYLATVNELGAPGPAILAWGTTEAVPYPPALNGVDLGVRRALLVFYRDRSPPPAELLWLDPVQDVVIAANTIAHSGSLYSLSQAFVTDDGSAVETSWYETLAPDLPPRLVTARGDFKLGVSIGRRLFPISAKVPRRFLARTPEGNLRGLGNHAGGSAIIESTLTHNSQFDATLDPKMGATLPTILHMDPVRRFGLAGVAGNILAFQVPQVTARETEAEATFDMFSFYESCLGEGHEKPYCLGVTRDALKN